MDERKTRKLGIIIVILAIIALLVFVYFTFFRNKEQMEEAGPVTPLSDQNQLTSEQEIVHRTYDFNAEAEAKRVPDQDDAERLAFSFAERFGSYSNQSNYGNITDLKLFMTDKMDKWTDELLLELKAKDGDGSSYYGINTKSLVSKTIEYSEAKAVFSITTSRSESLSEMDTADKTFNQNILITLIKEADDWKVDSAYWQ
jgi:hypothetical protein